MVRHYILLKSSGNIYYSCTFNCMLQARKQLKCTLCLLKCSLCCFSVVIQGLEEFAFTDSFMGFQNNQRNKNVRGYNFNRRIISRIMWLEVNAMCCHNHSISITHSKCVSIKSIYIFFSFLRLDPPWSLITGLFNQNYARIYIFPYPCLKEGSIPWREKIIFTSLQRSDWRTQRLIQWVPLILRSRDSVVGIGTSYGLDDRGVVVRVLVGSRTFSTSSRPPLGFPTSYPMGNDGFSPGVKREGHEADHSPPASAEVKKVDLYIHSSIRLHCILLN
jgi:hypothetical protein